MFGYPSLAEKVILLYAGFSVIPIAGSIIFLTSGKVTSDEWILVALIVLSLLLALLVLGLLKLLAKFLHKKYNVETLKQKRNEMLIGLGGIALSSFIPRILVFFFAGNIPVLAYIGYLSFGTIFFSALLFTLSREKKYKMDFSIDGTKCWIASSVPFHILLLIITIILGYEIYPKKSESDIVIFVQLLYSVIFGFSTFEFIQVFRGGLKLDNGENRTVRYQRRPQKVRTARSYGNRYESSGYSGDMGMAVVFAAASYGGDCGGGYGGGGDCGGGFGGGDCGGGFGGGDCGGGF